jgi:hypothetical protein
LLLWVEAAPCGPFTVSEGPRAVEASARVVDDESKTQGVTDHAAGEAKPVAGATCGAANEEQRARVHPSKEQRRTTQDAE